MKRKRIYLLAFAMFAACIGYIGTRDAYAATTITQVKQTPYMISDSGTNKTETSLTLGNSDPAYTGWVKISVTGKTPYMESVGTVSNGTSTKTVHVVELNNDGDNVTFQVYDNSAGTGTARASTTLSQKKIRHWTVYVAHDSHVDVGYIQEQEDLRNTQWPIQTDDAFTYITATNAWSPNDQFKYHFESSFLLDGSYLNVRNADVVQALKTQLAAGRLAYSSSYLNTSYEAMSTEQLVRFFYYSGRILKDKLGTDASGVALSRDNPSFSWAQVDAMADMGIKYMFLGFNLNPRTPLLITDAYPKLFYVKGKNPANKLLVFDGPLYNVDEMNFVPDGAAGTTVTLAQTVQAVSDTLMTKFQTSTYVGDGVLENVAQFWDNGPLYPQVKDRIKDMNARTDSAGRPYIYPKFVNSNMKDYYQYQETNFGGSIPTYQGTIENWWTYGIPSDAYSESVQKIAHERVPAAETFATFANQAATNFRFPYGKIFDAYMDTMLYDEHTFGPPDGSVGSKHIWKRSTAVTARNLADSVMNDALTALNTLIPTTDKTITVYNSLSWARSDVVKVKQSDLPAHFDITDVDTSAAVKYQKLSDGYASFVAPNVPGLGYKTFRVTSRANDPTFSSSIVKTDNTLENAFFKVTFGSQGEIVSIKDKSHSNAEMVDSASPYKMNEFLYITSGHDAYNVLSESKVTDAKVAISTGAVQGQMSSDGLSRGTAGVQRNVILYDDVPKIDIVNVVNKTDAPGDIPPNPGALHSEDEEGFFTFPLNVPSFTLRHEMPTGDVRPYVDSNIANPANEQFYTSSTDFYTVNRWIDASNASGSYGITLFPSSAPVVEYGNRRSLLYDVNYNTAKPWVFSNVYSNKWATNFIETQPGPTTFYYSIRTHGGTDWKTGKADKYGWETSVPLEAKVIAGAQAGAGFNAAKGQWVGVNKDNVVLTTAKIAEANGEGTILRFNETNGASTSVTVDLSYFSPTSVTETDLLENDKSAMTLTAGKVTFTIDAFGWKTIRLKYGTAPAQVTGLSATKDSLGARVAWTDLVDNKLATYEVFRDTSSGFTPGTGNYVGTSSTNSFYDRQMTTGATGTYYYKVRAVRGGLKGTPSTGVAPTNATNSDSPAPSAPGNLRIDYAFGNRVSVSWDPSTDNLRVKGYKIYRNAVQVADDPAIMNSHLDVTVVAGTSYTYTVKAYDQAGNLSAASNAVVAVPAKGNPVPGNIAPYATVTSSSQYSASFDRTAVADRIVGDTGEWASSGELNPWVQLTWAATVTIDRIVLYDRANDTDNANGGTLTFSDGTSIAVTGIPRDGAPKAVFFPSKNVTWAKFQGSGGAGSNNGLSEFEVYVPTGSNLAGSATATSSTQFSAAYAPALAADNVIGVHTSGEWASNAELNPWLQLTWSTAKTLGKIALYDRPNLLDNANGGLLTFSDGSSISVTGIPSDGSPLVVAFPAKSVTWVKFQIAGGAGSNVGLSEMQALQPDLAAGAPATASSFYGAGYEAANGTDGNFSTRWASVTGGAATQTYKVDLGANFMANKVGINWEYAYAANYTIAISTDDISYSTVVTKTGNTAQTTLDSFTAANARYVKVTMTAGAMSIYSFWDINVFAAP